MALMLGETAPDFTCQTTEGAFRFHEWMGDSWAILFSHPKDFTPVCTTELGEVARLKEEFEKRQCKVVALSVDEVKDHLLWKKDIEETQRAEVNYPIIADPHKKISKFYNMIHPESDNTLTVRSVFIIDPEKKVRLTMTYPASTGRNFHEILRVVDSLQLTDKFSVATPVNWRQGDDCMVVPSLSTEEARAKFPKGLTEVKPYMRVTPQPS